jgi:hypothetical protein
MLLFLAICAPETGIAQTRIRELHLRLKPGGFSQSQVQLNAGPIQIFVTNQAGVGTLSIRLERQGTSGTAALVSGTVNRNEKLYWAERVTLQPGTYFLRDSNYVNWVCQLVVQ